MGHNRTGHNRTLSDCAPVKDVLISGMRNYKRKTTRQNWTVENMSNAIKAVSERKISIRKASMTFSVPRSTLEDRIQKLKKGKCNSEAAASKGMGNYKSVFPPTIERELTEYIKLMESRLFGLTTADLRKLAFQLAERNNLPHNFNRKEGMAGVDWVQGFLKRNPDLSLRSPEATSAARACGFNRAAVNSFFQLLNSCIEEYKFPPTRIYNVDETGITSVPKTQSKIVAQKGRRQVGVLTSAERGQTITAEICMSAADHFVPPLLVLPRIRMKEELLDGTPPGTIAACHPSGWMQMEIFFQWIKHFAEHVKPSKEDPVLLLLDGHTTHTKNLAAIEYARENGIVMLCFPPHCTHRMQPLDVSFMGPLSSYYSQEVKLWLRNHPGRVVTQYQIGTLFGLAYAKAATMQIAISGFRKTGIYPTDQNIFMESDFSPADTTERSLDENDVPVSQLVPDNIHLDSPSSPQPGPSGLQSRVLISPEDIMPVPKAIRTETKRKRGKTSILTTSPYREELEGIISNSFKKTKVQRIGKGKQKIQNEKREDYTKGGKDVSEDICIYCKVNFFEKKKIRVIDGWVQCLSCKGWAHESCTKWNEEDLDDFECVDCLRKQIGKCSR